MRQFVIVYIKSNTIALDGCTGALLQFKMTMHCNNNISVLFANDLIRFVHSNMKIVKSVKCECFNRDECIVFLLVNTKC